MAVLRRETSSDWGVGAEGSLDSVGGSLSTESGGEGAVEAVPVGVVLPVASVKSVALVGDALLVDHDVAGRLAGEGRGAAAGRRSREGGGRVARLAGLAGS